MQANKPKGVFSASRISELLAGGTGKTRQSYILDSCLDILDLKPNFENQAMKHGIATEFNAYTDVVLNLFENSIFQSDKYIEINKNCGASPDVLIGKDTLDIKCPTIERFHSYAWSNPSSYVAQVQMQMLATGGEVGYLLYFLQKPITYENADTWKDYNYSNFDDNFILKEFKKDEQIQDKILEEVEKAVPIRNNILELLLNCNEYDFKYLCNYSKSGGRYAKLKESNNILKENIFKFENNFYFLKKN